MAVRAASIAVLVLAGLLPGAASRAAPAAPAEKPVLLAPDLELVELAPPDQRYDEAEDAGRAAMLSQRLRKALAASGRYALLDRGPQDRTPPYRYADCRACLLDWARKRGAQLVLVSWVQKESRLILSVNLHLIDLRRNTDHGGWVDLRGDTDEVWLAGTQQLLDRYLGVQAPL
jgi:hypothetical protein